MGEIFDYEASNGDGFYLDSRDHSVVFETYGRPYGDTPSVDMPRHEVVRLRDVLTSWLDTHKEQ